MMGRLRWFLLIAAAGGCYFETPRHSAQPDDNVDPVESQEGGTSAADDGGPIEPADGEVVTDPRDASMDGGGLDGAILETSPEAGEAGMLADAGPHCACDTGKVCLPGTSQCVECASDKDCTSSAKAKCDTVSHSCVACDAKGQCARFAGLNVCAGGNCVQCSAGDQTGCMGTAKPLCASTGNVCVACNVNADCTDPTKPTCDANACRTCRADADCAGKMSGSTTLDACYNGQCVDCRINPNDSKQDIGCSNATSCHPTTRTCSGKAKSSVDVCQACVADAECGTDQRCVPLSYRSSSVGNYCMRVAANCPAGYTAGVLTRTSVSGAPSANYCGISEERTTCEAVRALGASRTCVVASSCAVQGALCASINASAQLLCTHPCIDSLECPETARCGGAEGAKYCGGV